MKVRLLIPFLVILSASCTINKDADHLDYPMLTPVAELREAYELDLDTTGVFEKTKIIRYVDGSYGLDYTYDDVESIDNMPLYYSIVIDRELSEKDAISTFKLTKSILLKTNSLIGYDTEEILTVPLPGNEGYYALRTSEEEPVGLFLLIRKEKVVYQLVIAGLYSADHSMITDHILPKISQLESFEITD